jgi:hypothetical protein
MIRDEWNSPFWEELEAQMATVTDELEVPSVSAGSFLAHSVTALLGCGFCAAYAGVLLVRATGFDPAAHNSNLFMWYSPLIWWAGLLFGFIAHRRNGGSAACFTWVSGVLLLGLLMAVFFWTTLSWDRTVADIFPLGQAEGSPDDQLGVTQLFFVWPAVNSFAYSIGATLSLLFVPHKRA